MEKFDYEIVQLPAYRAVGLKWEGTYQEVVPHLKGVIQEMAKRAGELEHAVNNEVQLGLSYHTIPGGFVHYSVFEVTQQQILPPGMIEIQVPSMTYLKVHHEKGNDIGVTYERLHKWLSSAFQPYKEEGIQYFDEMPIKHERYPVERDLQDPHFDIMIPIIKKS